MMKRLSHFGMALILLTTVSCAEDEPPQHSALDGSSWRLVAWSLPSLDPSRFTITAEFRDGRISGRAAVNSYSAAYTTGNDGTFSVGDIQCTLMGGSEAAMEAESRFLEMLRQSRHYAVSPKTLRLRDAEGRDLLVFEALAAEEGRLQFTGTIRYVELEGGFYAIEADDSRKYEPMRLPREFQVDGLRVRVTARKRADMASIRMYGQIIEILDISKL